MGLTLGHAIASGILKKKKKKNATCVTKELPILTHIDISNILHTKIALKRKNIMQLKQYFLKCTQK